MTSKMGAVATLEGRDKAFVEVMLTLAQASSRLFYQAPTAFLETQRDPLTGRLGSCYSIVRHSPVKKAKLKQLCKELNSARTAVIYVTEESQVSKQSGTTSLLLLVVSLRSQKWDLVFAIKEDGEVNTVPLELVDRLADVEGLTGLSKLGNNRE